MTPLLMAAFLAPMTLFSSPEPMGPPVPTPLPAWSSFDIAPALAVGAPFMAAFGGGGSSQIYLGQLQGTQVVPPTGSMASGTVIASLNANQTALRYFIRINGLILPQGPPANPDDITAVHFHTASAGSNGPHVLNVFGVPSQDDRQLQVLFGLNAITGRWDDGDAVVFPPGPPHTKLLTDFIGALNNSDIYVQMHSLAFSSGEIRAQLIPFP